MSFDSSPSSNFAQASDLSLDDLKTLLDHEKEKTLSQERDLHFLEGYIKSLHRVFYHRLTQKGLSRC
jgi:hypothetical protein